MIQDIFPKHLKNTFHHEIAAEANDNLIFFENGRIYINYDSNNNELSFPKMADSREIINVIYLFSIDDQRFFLVFDKKLIPSSYKPLGLNEIRQLKIFNKENVYAVFTAFHLWKWYMDNQYCGRCGHATMHDSVERALVCPVCKNTIYPRLNPAVIIGIIHGEKILLTKYNTGFSHNALVAGFTEIGETLEETVQREVMEEVGLKVKNIVYYKSQPWGIAQDILVGFFCQVDGDETIYMDSSELKYANWVERDKVELQPTDYSLTNEMMKIFKEGKDPFSK
jgi:NAD+ diphosphatase